MFTGLIERMGTVKRVSLGASLVLEIAPDTTWKRPLEKGESIAVNGVCLTVADFSAERFTADVLKETKERSTLGELIPGDKVNLERAVRTGDSLGGHIVQGHVDCRGVIDAKIPKGRDFSLRIKCGRVFASSAVLKGSVAIDGTSLTISALGEDYFCVDLIPTTARETVLGIKKVGEKVNLEGDVIGKYVSSAIKAAAVEEKKGGSLTEEALAAAGFI
jgi:riboflavin synthase